MLGGNDRQPHVPADRVRAGRGPDDRPRHRVPPVPIPGGPGRGPRRRAPAGPDGLALDGAPGRPDTHRPALRDHRRVRRRKLDLPGDSRSASPPPSWCPPGPRTPRPAAGCVCSYAAGPATRLPPAGTSWAPGPPTTARCTGASVPGQEDDRARVAADTLRVTGATVTGWQVRVTLLRRLDAADGPVLHTVGVVASTDPPAPPDRRRRGRRRSPSRRRRRSPAGGERVGTGAGRAALHAAAAPPAGETRWAVAATPGAVPTCVSMVLDFWGAGPDRGPVRLGDAARPLRPGGATPPGTATTTRTGGRATGRSTPRRGHATGVDAFVTRLRSLAEAELFVAAGIPLIVSAAFTSRQGAGAGLSTPGTPHRAGRLHRRRRPGPQRPRTRRTTSGSAGPCRARRSSAPGRRAAADRVRAASGSTPMPPPPPQANW